MMEFLEEPGCSRNAGMGRGPKARPLGAFRPRSSGRQISKACKAAQPPCRCYAFAGRRSRPFRPGFSALLTGVDVSEMSDLVSESVGRLEELIHPLPGQLGQ